MLGVSAAIARMRMIVEIRNMGIYLTRRFGPKSQLKSAHKSY